MRGAGDELSIRERIAFYRRRRELSQSVLAGLVGRSEDWLSKVERGERQVNRVDVLVELARQLRVTLNDLLGEPVLFEDGDSNDDVPAVRDALMSPHRLSLSLFPGKSLTESVSVDLAAKRTEAAWNQYQSGRIGHVISVLPRLLGQARLLEAQARNTSPEGRRSCAVSARIHHLAATTLSKLGEAELAWIAAERAMHAAEDSEDPLSRASAARAATHALLALGKFDEALHIGQAAARRQDGAVTEELLQQAETAAAGLGQDANHWQTGFGPTNVELHRLAAWLELGDPTRVVDSGRRVILRNLPVERQATHAIDMARSFSMLARDDEALGVLLKAEADAPELVRHSSTVREVVRTLYRRSRVSNGKSSPLMALAERCRAVR
ncbi:helix-turn-helix domain-containing protein [Saccharopolyspora mangrovi]|uniref:Helix-turn-helix transcriptional regulator n=1 Tax=Saccharopolyspora mangrovi TaxID=3082379 RepID=A0ABU6A710_9PSEU|nr:helix-turn-helix transcriptional regulator [Saccharopolyspora sp. S2-29]MEB3367264.1 helix-turn-helix transcriptional regulator [Saccharopolyspora sp. S2-29]